MRTIIMPVTEEEARKILSGQKSALFKKHSPRSKIGEILLYVAPSPKKKSFPPPYHHVVASAALERLIVSEPAYAWAVAGARSGMTKQEFDAAFGGKTRVVTYLLSDIRRFKAPKKAAEFGLCQPVHNLVHVK